MVYTIEHSLSDWTQQPLQHTRFICEIHSEKNHSGHWMNLQSSVAAQGDYLQKAFLLSDSDRYLHPHLALLYVEHFVLVELVVVSDQDLQVVNRNTLLINVEFTKIRSKNMSDGQTGDEEERKERQEWKEKINFFNHFQRN